ncbi:MAG TPA: substrate-binding domain-containing protein [Pseudomonadota bacterium]|nr:substrate-binding domain-containing protein [Pseudomonadota bacterium]
MPDAYPSNKDLAREVLKVVLALLGLVWIAHSFSYGGDRVESLPQDTQLLSVQATTEEHKDICGAPSADGHALPLEMIYSDEKRDWIEFASDRFSHLCPHIQVKIRAMRDVEAADAIFAGQLTPTLWAPTDDLALKYLEHRFKQRGGPQPLLGAEKSYLIQSPIVMLLFQDRLRVLSTVLRRSPGEDGLWVRSLCSGVAKEPDPAPIPLEMMVPGTWAELYAPLGLSLETRKAVSPQVLRLRDEPFPTAEEIAKWGRVKIGHTPPTQDNAGLAALYLMAFDYVLAPKQRTASQPGGVMEDESTDAAPQQSEQDIGEAFEKGFADKKESLRKWLRRCEAGLPQAPKSSQALTAGMFNTGASLYDGVVTYEHLALPFLERVDKSATAMNKLVVIYPQPTLWARHPAVVLKATPQQHEGARKWLSFLLGKEMQEKAVEMGFRPIRSEVTVRGHKVDQNRFLRLRRHVMMREPGGAEAPRVDGSVIAELMGIWSEATGRL